MFDGKYLDWNQKRIKGIMDFYGHKFLYYKKILDLGCGHADISGVIHRLGADITAVDARQEHLKVASKKYNGIKIIKADLDKTWPFQNSFFDIILDLDTACHLSNFEEHLRRVCSICNHLVLETAVCDSDDPTKIVSIQENKAIYDLSFNGMGSFPTAAAVERILSECGMDFRRQDLAKYNSGSYTYDWSPSNDNSCNSNKRRLWFAIKNGNPIRFSTPSSPITGNPTNTIKNSHIPIVKSQPIVAQQSPKSFVKNETPEPSKNTEIKNMRVALCISGHLRTYENNYRSVIDQIISKYNCDVFIHTWDTLGISSRHLDHSIINIKTESVLNRIKFIYNPKEIVVEPNKGFVVTPLMQSRLIDHRDIHGILSMFYKIEACNDLKKKYEEENGFVYDYVIRFRPDLYMELPLPINKNTDPDRIYFPTYGNFGGLCDQIAFGNSKLMDVYSSLYSNIDSYMEEGAPMHPEKLMKYHIDKQKIPYSSVNMRYIIKRSNGLVQNNQILERALGYIK